MGLIMRIHYLTVPDLIHFECDNDFSVGNSVNSARDKFFDYFLSPGESAVPVCKNLVHLAILTNNEKLDYKFSI